jgi:ubiquinone/menaquinone biosynthesis C-methylase UbiE
MGLIDKQRRIWEGHGKTDPLWAVLTDPRYKGGKWDAKKFYATGEKEISAVFKKLKSLRINFRKNNALDFGCGAGRLTKALAKRFSKVTGVDISEPMIAAAQKYVKGRGIKFVINASNRLEGLKDGSADFVYAGIVLQHIPPALSSNYIKEFMRALKPGGLAVFNIPAQCRVPLAKRVRYALRIRTRVKEALNFLRLARFENFDPHPIAMHVKKPRQVEQIAKQAGGRVVKEFYVNTAEDSYYTQGITFSENNPGGDYPTVMYVIRKGGSF